MTKATGKPRKAKPQTDRPADQAPAKPAHKAVTKPAAKPRAAARPSKPAARRVEATPSKPAAVHADAGTSAQAEGSPPDPMPTPGQRARDPFGMTPREARFVDEYMVDLNGSQAYRRANPKAAESTARNEAAVLLRKPTVAAAVAARTRQLRDKVELKAVEVVRLLGLMATADERELMEVRIGCCRYCWGAGNRYQRTAAEMERAMVEHAAKLQAGEPVGDFDMQGGQGFNANHPPNPDCGECFGDGLTRPVFKDTRNLSEGAALLFAGVKVTKDGMEIKTHNRADALVNLGRHFGLFKDRLQAEVKVDVVDELRQYLGARGSRLPVGGGSTDA